MLKPFNAWGVGSGCDIKPPFHRMRSIVSGREREAVPDQGMVGQPPVGPMVEDYPTLRVGVQEPTGSSSPKTIAAARLSSRKRLLRIAVQLHSNMIDKSWIESPIKSKEFSDGVVQFLEFAFSNASIDGKILCPCIICGFSVMCNRAEVFSHLLQRGFPQKYTYWHMHGEKHVQCNVESISQVQNESTRQYPMNDMLNDVFGIFDNNDPSNLPNNDNSREHRPAPVPPSGLTLLRQIEKSRKRPRDDGTNNYASNISRCVDLKKRKISNLKSHDSHILMEHLLPIACRRALPTEVTSVLIELCNYFREISSKVLDVKHVENLQQRIWLNHANMEAIFPPSFFTIMFHLVIHIGEEAILAGPVQGHWMYPVERGMGHFKSYVHNNSAAEGCIAEGSLTEENLTNCSMYFEDVNIETRFNRPRRNDDDNEINASSESTILSRLFPASGKPIGAIKTLSISSLEIIQAHRYVLTNCEIIDAFREKFRIEVSRMYRGKRNCSKLVEEYVHKQIHEWFKEYVASQNGVEITPEIEVLANGPNNVVRRFKEYNIHGFKFRTMWKEQGLKTQNSGVVMSAVTKRFSNGRESIEQSSDDMYYGKLIDIIELNYYGKLKVVLFKCLWVDTTLNKGIKIDQFGITSVNFSCLMHTGAKETDEPFILASDARMVYYVDDPIDEDWCCVCHMKPRDIYDMGNVDFVDLEEPPMEDIPFCEQHLENIEDLPLVRVDRDEQEQGDSTNDDGDSGGDDGDGDSVGDDDDDNDYDDGMRD
ncbi:hypothetical protein KY284_032555 [Solanum tuberosum]|nr:hypothetical protein KY284_032555 [Solanum tuberosum]